MDKILIEKGNVSRNYSIRVIYSEPKKIIVIFTYRGRTCLPTYDVEKGMISYSNLFLERVTSDVETVLLNIFLDLKDQGLLAGNPKVFVEKQNGLFALQWLPNKHFPIGWTNEASDRRHMVVRRARTINTTNIYD